MHAFLILLSLFALGSSAPKKAVDSPASNNKNILPSFKTLIDYVKDETEIPKLLNCILNYYPEDVCEGYPEMYKAYCLAPIIAEQQGKCGNACSAADENSLKKFIRSLSSEQPKVYAKFVYDISERGYDTFEQYCVGRVDSTLIGKKS